MTQVGHTLSGAPDFTPFREFMIPPIHYIYIIWICQFWDYVYGLMTGLFAKIILIDVLDLFYYNMHEYVSIWVLDVAHFVYFQIRLALCFRLSTPGHPLLNSPLIVLLAWHLSQVYAVKHYRFIFVESNKVPECIQSLEFMSNKNPIR